MRHFYPITLCLLLLPFIGFAQPANDECANAIELTDIRSWCSEVGEFTNEGATETGFSAAGCFSGAENDVWFTFTPVATDVTVTVIGNQGSTLAQPEVALYFGDCDGTINELRCESAGNNFVIELYRGGLAVGVPHLIRIQGRNGNTGTFQLCINNFNPPVNPGSDCISASVLCSKDQFVVQQVVGAGADATEANDAECLNVFGNVESNSTWFTWTAATTGSLTFNLRPLNPPDDLDFVVYRLPNGPLDCSGKEVLRCMASSCFGSTGLDTNNNDTSEPPGCTSSNQNNFLRALDMVEGESYGLMINNFSATGNGFELEFGGTGEFVGPTADFETDDPDQTICLEDDILISDISTFAFGTITEWQWNFGVDASPASADTRGPHAVSYTSPGVKSVVLTVTTDRGCIVTEIDNILVECCPGHFSVEDSLTNLACFGFPTGAIEVTPNSSFPPFDFAWDSGQATARIANLEPGDYTVTVTDAATCDTVITYTVESPTEIQIDTFITMPTCNGGTDGAIMLNVMGGTPPYQFNWQNTGFTDDNTLINIPNGDYQVFVRDFNNCQIDLTIPVRELALVLDPSVVAVTPPSCNGFSDGSIEVVVANGLPPYQYDWNDGLGFRSDNSLTQVAAGTYIVNIRDANLCTGTFEFVMEDFPPITLMVDQVNASCNGVADGSILLIPDGGVGDFKYAWSNGLTFPEITDLASGDYTVTVIDGNGCELIETITITEPVAVNGQIIEVVDVICNGEPTGSISVTGIGGTAPFEYSTDGLTFQSDSVLTNLPAGIYTITIRDAQGCLATVPSLITEPIPLIVDAGPDQTINLGSSTRIQAVANDPDVIYSWNVADSTNCSGCPTRDVTPFQTTTFVVTALDSMNCSATDSITINVNKVRPVFIPNAFSPNGDGRNDILNFNSNAATSLIRTFKVFDRWGSLLFETSDIPTVGETPLWDGTANGEPLNTGIYVYFVEVEFIDGIIELFEGDVLILR